MSPAVYMVGSHIVGNASGIFATPASGGSGFYPAGHWVNSPLTLTFLGPRTSMASIAYNNAYPGVAYRVPVVLIGGAWPYVFTLTSAPSGMTIGQTYGVTDYGIINWSNPVAGTYTITVSVQDQNRLTAITVSWTLAVGTAGFIFLDSMNGSPSVPNGGTGTGTLLNPFKDLNDWWWGAAGSAGTQASRKADTTYAGYICYYKNGTYTTNSCQSTEPFNSGNNIGGIRVPMVVGNKPKVHLAYPGASPVWDVTAAALAIYADSTYGWWLHGITSTGVNNTSDQKFIAMDAGSTDVVVFECTFGAQTGTSGNNPTPFMILANGTSTAQYVSMVNNTYQGLTNAECVEWYSTILSGCHGNTVGNSSEGNGGGFYFKQDCQQFSIRQNVSSSGNTTCLCRYDNFLNLSAGTQAEICWNNYQTSTTSPSILFGTFGNNWGTVGIFRNTWRGQYCQVNVSSGTGSGTFNVGGDVNVGDGSQTNNWDLVTWAGTLNFDANYLTGTLATGIVDTNGNLQGSFRTSNLGLSGHEVA